MELLIGLVVSPPDLPRTRNTRREATRVMRLYGDFDARRVFFMDSNPSDEVAGAVTHRYGVFAERRGA